MTSADWNLTMVRSREARLLLPQGPLGVDWSDIRVAHLDTGYTRHPAFGYRAGATPWLRPGDGLNALAPGEPLDPLDYAGNPGHGTRTCSVLCGEAVPMPGEPPVGSEIGVAPRLPVVPCRVVESVVLLRREHRQAVADGIRHAIEQGCGVASISLGVPVIAGFGRNHLGLAVDAAYEAGLIVVAAGGQIVDSVCYPAKFNRTIGVGGVTAERRIWFDYQAGRDEIDVWAPARDVLREDSLATAGAATLPPVEGADPGAQTLSGRSGGSGGSSLHSGLSGPGTGTSYATVHVAAAAAMWLRRHGPELAARYADPWQRVEAFRLLLRQTARPISGQAPGNGTGILNIEALLRAPLPAASGLDKATEDKNKTN